MDQPELITDDPRYEPCRWHCPKDQCRFSFTCCFPDGCKASHCRSERWPIRRVGTVIAEEE